MAFSNSSGTKCPKCEMMDFELVEDFPANATYKFYYIRCRACQTFLQAIPFIDINDKIDFLQEDINGIKSKLGLISESAANISDEGL